jgi:hypothetical protein
MKLSRKRVAVLFVGFVELSLVIILLLLIFGKAKSLIPDPQYAIRLKSDYYRTVIKSDRFPHYYEPQPDTIINDHPAWLGEPVSYSINHDSLNERMDYPMARVPGVNRIITLGDSFTYGLFVDTTENYSERLEDMLNAEVCNNTGESFEVINLGVPAYDIGYAAERYRLRGEKYHPDLVIWWLNSFTMGIDAERKTALEEKYLNEIPEGERWRTVDGKEQFYPGMLAWLTHIKEATLEQRETRQAYYLREFLRSFEGPLLIVANDWDTWSASSKKALTSALLYRENVRLLPVSGLLQRGVSLLADEHPNREGHRIIANLLSGTLVDKRLLPCLNTHLDE